MSAFAAPCAALRFHSTLAVMHDTVPRLVQKLFDICTKQQYLKTVVKWPLIGTDRASLEQALLGLADLYLMLRVIHL